jgi:transcriptional regulator with XRE-family HTH domain
MDKSPNSLGFRLKIFRESQNLSQKDIGDLISITKNTVSSIETGKSEPSHDLLIALRKSHNLNITWVLTGEGEMFEMPNGSENASEKRPTQLPEIHNVSEAILVKSYEIPFVPIPAYASFLEFAGDVHIKTLSKIAVFASSKPDKRSIAFEIQGNSMAPEAMPGDTAICREIPPSDWDYLTTVDLYIFALADMITLKRVQRVGADSLNFIPSNRDYAPFAVPAERVKRVFRVEELRRKM